MRHAFPSLTDAALALEQGATTASALVEEALDRATAGEGPRAFTALHARAAREAALSMDGLRRVGRHPSRFAGIPITVKDLFDEAGEVTRAGSRALDRGPAARTAPAIARLQRQGFVVLGRTNMTEFAFSGLGVNPHHGTPASPWDRATGRLPGGSSSGAGVAAADGMGFGGVGTDTGGSCRIPAALCGVVGFKPTARRVPLEGAFPLSASLDSIGPLARSVADCHAMDAVMAGAEEVPALVPAALGGLRVGVLHTLVEDGLVGEVARPYARALAKLEAAGARLSDLALPALGRIAAINAKGGLTAAEAWALHRHLVAEKAAAYDPRILARIRRGEAMSAADHLEAQQGRREVQAACAPLMAAFDVVACPTVPIPPPALAEVEPEAEYGRINLLLLRNPAVANFLDICAISLPCHEPGDAPAGLMLMAPAGHDARLLEVAAAVEAALEG